MGLCASRPHCEDLPPDYDARSVKTSPQPATSVFLVTQVPAPRIIPQVPICPCGVGDKHRCVASDVVVGATVRLEFFETCVGERNCLSTVRCKTLACHGVDIIPTLGGYRCIKHAAEYMKLQRQTGFCPTLDDDESID